MPTSIEIYNSIISGSRDLNKEISSLTPSTPIILYEIDLSEVSQRTVNFDYNGTEPMNKGVIRVYNDYNLYKLSSNNGKIKFQNNFYYPFPIFAEGFEYTSAGVLPTPTLTLSNTSPDNSYNSFHKYIRMQIQSLGDILGAKFTRIKTFLKYLSAENFQDNVNPFNQNPSLYEMELPRDIYYIDRKSIENKTIIEYKLNTILDLENINLPGRTVLSKKCPFSYRGEGCCYEYNSRLTSLHSGVYANTVNSPISVRGLQTAPPVANENNELFVGDIFSTTGVGTATGIFRLTGTLGNSGKWLEGARYVSGDFVFLENQNLKYYYVCINNNTASIFNAPPAKTFWIADSCDKSITACRYRWLKNPAFRPVLWPENRGGESFARTNKRLGIFYEVPERVYFLTGINGTPVYFPRRPGSENPSGLQSHGIPKDSNGNYLNGFLPFGGFPGTTKS
jgi:lambda family phage minor tail protein L